MELGFYRPSCHLHCWALFPSLLSMNRRCRIPTRMNIGQDVAPSNWGPTPVPWRKPTSRGAAAYWHLRPGCLNKIPLTFWVCIRSLAQTLALSKRDLCCSKASGCNEIARELQTVFCGTAVTEVLPKRLRALPEAHKHTWATRWHAAFQQQWRAVPTSQLWGCCCD